MTDNPITGLMDGHGKKQLNEKLKAIDAAIAGIDSVDDAIVNGETNRAPSQNVVYDALLLKVSTSEKGAANGVATLGADTKVPNAQLPALAITDTFVVASQAAQVALTAETGDVAVRTDENKSYILTTDDPTIFANWQELLTPTDSVTSVNGQNGTVSLDTDDITEGGTNLYFTDARAKTAAVADTITDGIVDVAPSQNTVFDALALKANTADLAAVATSGDAADVIFDPTGLNNTDAVDVQEAIADIDAAITINAVVANLSATGKTSPFKLTLPAKALIDRGLCINTTGNSSLADLVCAVFPTYTGTFAELTPRKSCRLATTAALVATYNNGASGVGATLTNNDTQAALEIDSIPVDDNDYVLIKDQVAPEQNGIYIVTDKGSIATDWILTRSTDFDQTAEVVLGAYTYVLDGTDNNNTLHVFIQNTSGTITLGTTAIEFSNSTQPPQSMGAATPNSVDSKPPDNFLISTSGGNAGFYSTTLAVDILFFTVDGNTPAGGNTPSFNGVSVDMHIRYTQF